jgi:hypothetical protein
VTVRLNSSMKLQLGHVHKETKNAYGIFVRKRPGKRLTGDKKNKRKITNTGHGEKNKCGLYVVQCSY